MSNPAVDGTGNIIMFGTAHHTTTAPYIAPPVVEVQEAPGVDLYRVAYHRDNSSYDDLLSALLTKVSSLQAQLRNLT